MTTGTSSASTSEPDWQFECPDPRHPDAPRGSRTHIVIQLSAVRHLLERHVRPRNQEPWEELLGVEGRRRHRQDHQADPTDLVTALRDQLERSLAKPQAMLAIQSQPRSNHGPHWYLVLPCGALAILGCGSLKPQPTRTAWLKTCYFPKEACEQSDPEQRWSATALERLRYCFALPTSGQRPVMSPVPASPVRVGARELGQIRFVTPETWWFDANHQLRPRLRTTWDGRDAPPPPRRKLAPRRR